MPKLTMKINNEDTQTYEFNNKNTPTPPGPGGDISNKEVTFTEAEERVNIFSGETLATICGKIKKFFTDLKTVAFSGSYNDLEDLPTLFDGDYNSLANKPTIPTKTSQLQNDSGFTTFSGNYNDLSNKPTLFSGDYNDLTNKPTISQVGHTGDYDDLTNKPTLFSGDYDDLTNKPTIPVVNNATLTIKQGGTTKGTFTANAGSDVEINLDAGGSGGSPINKIVLKNSSSVEVNTKQASNPFSTAQINVYAYFRQFFIPITTISSFDGEKIMNVIGKMKNINIYCTNYQDVESVMPYQLQVDYIYKNNFSTVDGHSIDVYNGIKLVWLNNGVSAKYKLSLTYDKSAQELGLFVEEWEGASGQIDKKIRLASANTVNLNIYTYEGE